MDFSVPHYECRMGTDSGQIGPINHTHEASSGHCVDYTVQNPERNSTTPHHLNMSVLKGSGLGSKSIGERYEM